MEGWGRRSHPRIRTLDAFHFWPFGKFVIFAPLQMRYSGTIRTNSMRLPISSLRPAHWPLQRNLEHVCSSKGK